ncbi:MAG: VWA domain-containing protein [Vicinamibacterales bacterium]
MRRLLLSIVLVATPCRAAAQQPTAPPDTPIFRSGVDLVTIDATVVDNEGRPIEGLRASDFELRVDGRPRVVTSAEFVAVASGERGVTAEPRPAHYSTNEHAPSGRLILFAVDQEHIRPAEGMAALRAAGRFIDGLHAGDRVAVTGIPRLGAMLDFTTNHRAARVELERLVGQAMPVPVFFNIGLSEALEISEGSRQHLDVAVRRECGTTLSQTESPARTADAGLERDPCPVQVEQEARALSQYARNQARTSLGALRGIIDSLTSIDEPKTIILVSEGLVAEPRYVDFSQLAAAAAAARVTIHVLQLETPVQADASQERLSPTTLQDRFLREDGLSRLAGAARGGLFPMIGDGAVALARIARELSGYYLLGFEAGATDRDGRVHRIELKLRARRANVRARQAFSAGPQPARQRAVAGQLAGLLRSPRLATELPLRVSTYTYQEPGSGKLRVVVSAEMTPATDPVSHATLAFVLLDARNVIAASATQVVSNGRHAFSTVVAPGDYTLKVAGIDPLGRRGSVERGFAARLGVAGWLRVSDLLVAASPASPEDPLHPAIDRLDEEEIVAYLELYADEALPLRQATVRMEVASTEDGPSVVTIPARLHRRDARWSIARVQVPIDTLPTGRYFLRAQVNVDGEPVKRLVRPFAVERPARGAAK